MWSVEVLPSDSEPPDVQSDDRLRELEAEASSAGSVSLARTRKDFWGKDTILIAC